MYRMKMPSTILNAGYIDFTGKAGPEDEAYLAAVKKQELNVIKKVQAQPDWDKFLKQIPDGTPKTEIAQFMLEPTLDKVVNDEVELSPDMKTSIIQIVSTPEYQLC
jgi:predicted AAA+ superfamily ATPase